MIRALTLSLLLPVSAFAQTADAAMAPASPFAGMLPLAALVLVGYFLILRPQQKWKKAQEAMLSALKKGDEVVTAGGIVGKITKVDAGETVTVEIAKGVEVSVVRATISTVVGKVTPAPISKKSAANNDENVVPSKEKVANDN